MKRYNTKKIGTKYNTKQGYCATIIDGSDKKGCCTIELNGLILENVDVATLTRGTVKNPMHPTLHKVGFIGIGDYSSKGTNGKFTKAYTLWSDLIKRCYSPKSLKRDKAYKDVVVCEEWHNFQNFAKWFYASTDYVEGYHIDKDLLSKGNKVYSPNTCCFLPKELNIFLTNKSKVSDCGHVGVKHNGNNYQAQIGQDYLGSYKSIEDAALAYNKAKVEKIQDWINMKEEFKLSDKVIAGLESYATRVCQAWEED